MLLLLSLLLPLVFHFLSRLFCHHPAIYIYITQVFDKTVRALESAVNRLPGMHEMGLEHLLLEEPAPPAPPTPTATPATPGAAAAAGTAGPGTAAAVAPPRPTAPGKRSIPWAFDAIGPLSALARKVCLKVIPYHPKVPYYMDFCGVRRMFGGILDYPMVVFILVVPNAAVQIFCPCRCSSDFCGQILPPPPR